MSLGEERRLLIEDVKYIEYKQTLVFILGVWKFGKPPAMGEINDWSKAVTVSLCRIRVFRLELN